MVELSLSIWKFGSVVYYDRPSRSFKLTQSQLFTTDSNVTFPDLDELFSQVPLPIPIPECDDSLLVTNTGSASATSNRFGPLVSASQVIARQEAAMPVNTQKIRAGPKPFGPNGLPTESYSAQLNGHLI